VTKQDDEFLVQLLAAFHVEAGEHLQAVTAGLLELEKTTATAQRKPLIETVYREAHSLKGAARAVNAADIENVCQSMENVFSAWKRGDKQPSPEALDEAHRSLDRLGSLLAGRSPAGQTQPAGKPAEVVAAPEGDTVRVTTGKLDALLREAEEMLAVKLTTGQHVAELQNMAALFEPLRREWARIQPELRLLRQLTGREGGPPRTDTGKLLEFCERNVAHLRAIEARLETLTERAQRDHHNISRMVDDLLDDSKRLLMLPFTRTLGIIPKLVRDLCRDQGKDADVILRGAEAEIDKRILEEMKDPLVHLIRNSVDHGLETPEQRTQKGKPPRGTVAVTIAEVEGNKVEIVISDDGAGIDADRVREAAARHGLISTEDASQLDDDAAVALIFQSAVSTSATVSAISGRGLGLAIVREKVEKLGGRVFAESTSGRGTTFRILLPTTLATFRGVLVEVASQVFVVPTADVGHIAQVQPRDVRTVENRETISLNGRALSLARLENVLELGRAAPPPDTLTAVVVVAAGRQIAFAVDEVLGETEVLVKPLRKPLARVRNVAGATILGSGKVVPVLNVADLMTSAVTVRAPLPPVEVAPQKTCKTVLVVEDSITSRMLLKHILESAGYRVETAVDGMDALTTLKTESVDAVVSDIEMPRLNGLGLTEKIRGDTRLADTPVILVSALESPAVRERGVEVGANAYLVKSCFDQSNLLETLERLVAT
jgi:two-component system, chemotaxis family, sensor kinase CheA